MFQKNTKSVLIKALILFVPIFIIVYSGVMLWKYFTHDELTWLKTFSLMFFIPLIVIVVGKTKKKSDHS